MHGSKNVKYISEYSGVPETEFRRISQKFPHKSLGAGAAVNITSCSLAIQVNGHTNLKGNIQKPVPQKWEASHGLLSQGGHLNSTSAGN